MMTVMEPDADRYVRAAAMAAAALDDDVASIYGDGFERTEDLPSADVDAAWMRVVSAVLHTVSRASGVPAPDVLSLALLELEGGVPLAEANAVTGEPKSVVTVVTDMTAAGRELRLHLDPMGLLALRLGQPIVVTFDEAGAEGVGFAQVVVTTASPV